MDYRPCRIPQFQNLKIWMWLTFSMLVFSTITVHEALVLIGLIPFSYSHFHPSCYGLGLWLIPLGGSIPYVLYQWRYTFPKEICVYRHNAYGDVILSWKAHIFCSAITVFIIYFGVAIFGMPTLIKG